MTEKHTREEERHSTLPASAAGFRPVRGDQTGLDEVRATFAARPPQGARHGRAVGAAGGPLSQLRASRAAARHHDGEQEGTPGQDPRRDCALFPVRSGPDRVVRLPALQLSRPRSPPCSSPGRCPTCGTAPASRRQPLPYFRRSRLPRRPRRDDRRLRAERHQPDLGTKRRADQPAGPPRRCDQRHPVPPDQQAGTASYFLANETTSADDQLHGRHRLPPCCHHQRGRHSHRRPSTNRFHPLASFGVVYFDEISAYTTSGTRSLTSGDAITMVDQNGRTLARPVRLNDFAFKTVFAAA